jgi:hypothetical protein
MEETTKVQAIEEDERWAVITDEDGDNLNLVCNPDDDAFVEKCQNMLFLGSSREECVLFLISMWATDSGDEYVPTDEELDSLSLDAARLETEMKLFGSTRNRTLDMNTGEILEGAYGAAYVVSSLREVAFNDDQIIGILMSRGLPVPEELIKKDEPGN